MNKTLMSDGGSQAMETGRGLFDMDIVLHELHELPCLALREGASFKLLPYHHREGVRMLCTVKLLESTVPRLWLPSTADEQN